jgi:hypothetical protein
MHKIIILSNWTYLLQWQSSITDVSTRVFLPLTKSSPFFTFLLLLFHLCPLLSYSTIIIIYLVSSVFNNHLFNILILDTLKGILLSTILLTNYSCSVSTLGSSLTFKFFILSLTDCFLTICRNFTSTIYNLLISPLVHVQLSILHVKIGKLIITVTLSDISQFQIPYFLKYPVRAFLKK